MSEIKDTRWKPNDKQREILEQLVGFMNEEESQAEFIRKYWNVGTGSMFTQIIGVLEPPRLNAKNELVVSYFDRVSEQRRAQLFEELEALVEEIPRQRTVSSRIKEIKIYKTTKIRAVSQAVRECSDKPGPERLVVSLAPSGGGKTITCNHLAEKFNARFVEVRDVWRDSKTGYIPLLDICKAVGLRVKKKSSNNIAMIQDDLIKFCQDRKIVLCFDEGEHFGKAALNLLKLLLNKTRIVPVVFVVPNEYERWQDYWENEATQIARRTHAIIELSVIENEDAAMFFKADTFEKKEEALSLITREASAFGHFSLVARVANRLDGSEEVSNEDVKKAIASALKQMKREVKQAAA